MYVYISEDSNEIRNFSNEKLIWKQEGIIYGDWYSGPNNDGTYTFSTKLPLSQVLPSINTHLTFIFFTNNLQFQLTS